MTNAKRQSSLAALQDRHVTDVTSFLSWVTEVSACLGNRRLWFRGLESSSFALLPKALRGYQNAEDLAFRRASDQLFAFKDLARARHDFPAQVANGDLGAWLTLAQHFGLNTLLLDWTRNSLAALWFATRAGQERGSQFRLDAWRRVEDLITRTGDERTRNRIKSLKPRVSEPCAIWAISPELVQDPTYRDTENLLLTKSIVNFAYQLHNEYANELNDVATYYGSPTKQPDEWRKLLIAVPALANEEVPRAFAQQGAFTIHFTVQPLDEKVLARAAGARCRIAAEHKWSILRELRHLGVEQATMFPDIANLADWINRTRGRPGY